MVRCSGTLTATFSLSVRGVAVSRAYDLVCMLSEGEGVR